MKKQICIFIKFLYLVGYIYMPNILDATRPEQLADSELQVWKAYYEQEPQKIGEALHRFLVLHYNVSTIDSKALAPLYGEALMKFAQTPQTSSQNVYTQTVLPSLQKALLELKKRSKLKFNPGEVSQAELKWWIARRGSPEEYDPKNVARLMRDAYVSLYGGIKEEYELSATHRATAARLRDEYWEAHLQKGEKSLSDEEWLNVEKQLTEAYKHFPMNRLKGD